jgi:hypothetical protein
VSVGRMEDKERNRYRREGSINIREWKKTGIKI